MIIDCISDLHGFRPRLDGGDLLIIAGDLTARHQEDEYDDFMGWVDVYEHSYKKIVIIGGNHDPFLEANPEFISSHGYENIEYLCDSGTEFEGLKIWGSPWTKRFKGMNPNCMAFTCDTEKELSEKWMLIPRDTNVLITHSPSFGNYDWTKNPNGTIGPSLGSPWLWMWMLTMVPNLKLHVTGHIHEAYGHSKHQNGIHLVNASHVNERYKPVNKPIRIIL